MTLRAEISIIDVATFFFLWLKSKLNFSSCQNKHCFVHAGFMRSFGLGWFSTSTHCWVLWNTAFIPGSRIASETSWSSSNNPSWDKLAAAIGKKKKSFKHAQERLLLQLNPRNEIRIKDKYGTSVLSLSTTIFHCTLTCFLHRISTGRDGIQWRQWCNI